MRMIGRTIAVLVIALVLMGACLTVRDSSRLIEPRMPGQTPSPITLYICGVYSCDDVGIYHAFTVDTNEPVMWGFMYCDPGTTHPTLIMRPMTGVDRESLPMAITIRRTDGVLP